MDNMIITKGKKQQENDEKVTLDKKRAQPLHLIIQTPGSLAQRQPIGFILTGKL
jgi:hypothetical protein